MQLARENMTHKCARAATRLSAFSCRSPSRAFSWAASLHVPFSFVLRLDVRRHEASPATARRRGNDICRRPRPWYTDGLGDVSRDRVADSLRQCRAIVLLDPHRCQPYWVLGDPRFTSRAQSPVVRSALRDSRNVHVRGHRWRLGPPRGAVGAAQLPPSQNPRCSLDGSLVGVRLREFIGLRIVIPAAIAPIHRRCRAPLVSQHASTPCAQSFALLGRREVIEADPAPAYHGHYLGLPRGGLPRAGCLASPSRGISLGLQP